MARIKVRLWFVPLLASLAIVGCTRDKASTARISIQLPAGSSVGAPAAKSAYRGLASRDTPIPAGTKRIEVIVLNVSPTSGASFSAIFQSWSHDHGTPMPVGQTLSFDLPTGSGCIVQVLLVEKDSDGNMIFNYDDKTVTLTGESVPVDLAPVPIGGAGAGDGSIMGRYLTGTNTGPTGIIDVAFTPGSGKPPMIVEKSEIFGGYFSTFGLQSRGFTYTVEGGPTLFTNFAISALNSKNAAFPNASTMVYVPKTYRCNADFGQTVDQACPLPTDFESNQARLLLMGYFGPGVTSANKMCFDAVTGTAVDVSTYAYSDVSATPLNLKWKTSPVLSSPSGTVAGIVGTAGVGGGLNYSGSNCPGLAFQDFMHLTTNNVASGDSALQFRGPFQSTAGTNGGGSFLQFATVTSKLGVTWTYLPGAASDITGSEVFYLPQTDTSTMNGSYNQPYHISNGNGFLCDQLRSNFGFTTAGQVPASANSILIPGLTAASNVEIVVCPFKTVAGKTTYFTSGVDGNPSGMMGAPGKGPAYLLKLVSGGSETPASPVLASNQSQGLNTCKKYDVRLEDAAGPTLAPAAFNITLFSDPNGSGRSMGLYSNSGCSTVLPSLLMAKDANTVSFYAKSPTAGGVLSIRANTNAAFGVGQGYWNIYAVDTGATPDALAISVMSFNPTPNLAVGECYPVQFSVVDNSSPPLPAVSATALDGFTPQSGGGDFFVEPDCSGAAIATPIVIPQNESEVTYYFKPSTVGGSHSITTNIVPAQVISVQQTPYFDVEGFSSPTWYNIKLNTTMAGTQQALGVSFAPSGCTMVNVQRVTLPSQIPVYSASPETLILASAHGDFYNDAACTQVATQPVTYEYPPLSMLYFKNSGSFETFSLSGGSISGSISDTISINPASIVVQSTGSTVCTASMGCVLGLTVSLRDETGGPYVQDPRVSSLPVVVNSSSSAFGIVTSHPSTGCSGSQSNQFNFDSSNQSMVAGGICPLSGSATGVTTTITASFNGVTSAPITVTGGAASAPGAASKLVILGPVPPNTLGKVPVKAGACESIKAYLADAAGNWVTSSVSGGSLSGTAVTTLGNSVYSDSTCGSVTTTAPSLSPSPGQPPDSFYFKDATHGAVGLAITQSPLAPSSIILLP